MNFETIQLNSHWSNWDKTPFSTFYLPRWINKPRFIRFHMQFFKFKYVSNIIKYEVGAKFLLRFFQDRENVSKLLRTSLSCIDLIRNPDYLELNDCFYVIKMNFSNVIWDKFSPLLFEYNSKKQTHNVLEILYDIYLKQIHTLDSHEECINLMNMIRLNDIKVKDTLTLIYDDSL